MNTKQREEYLKTLDNSDKFLEWYKQDTLECGWTSSLPTPEPTHNVLIPDPLTVNRIERSIGRTLTEEELEEDYVLFRKKTEKGYEYRTVDHDSWLELIEDKWEECKIPRVSFPDEV